VCEAVRLVPPPPGRRQEDAASARRGREEGPASASAEATRLAAAAAASSPDEHLVSEPLPLWRDPAGPFPTRHWAGHLPASPEDDKYLFYWLFEPPQRADDANAGNATIPLVIWLNGGPGCSSMDGLWLENGPFRLALNSSGGNSSSAPADADQKYGVAADPHSWHLAPAYALYVDQPVGTGLSFTKTKTYPSDDASVNVDFYRFLLSFFGLHAALFVKEDGDKKVVNRPVYFSGV
jgi:carboxypeptidase D